MENPGYGAERDFLNVKFFQIYKKLIVDVFVCLGSSADFLSAIFGIYGKFWIDIGVQKNFRRTFSLNFFLKMDF